MELAAVVGGRVSLGEVVCLDTGVVTSDDFPVNLGESASASVFLI